MSFSQEEGITCTQDANDCVKEIVKAILILDHSKKPFKHTDIRKFLTKKPDRKSWEVVMKQSKEKLKEMGLKLIEVNHANSVCYILTSSLFPLSSMFKFAQESEIADRTLLVLVLAFIFMKQGPVSSDDVFNHLEKLNIYSEDQPIHPYFGDIKKKLLNEFVSQLYLEKTVEENGEGLTLKWGDRALAEVSKKSILEFVCSIGYENTIQPKNLASHYQEVLQEEEKMNSNESQANEMEVED